MEFNEKELAFLRILCSYSHRQAGQDTIRDRLVEDEVVTVDEFKVLKKKLLYSGVIGIVYGNITLEKNEVLDLFTDD